jgi:predicted DNA-binding transcriptional regulator YafY
MTRTERLLQLLELLRQHRRAVSGRTLAEQMHVSLRTLYRDIATLQAQGAQIEGEAGTGYVLRAGYTLPPLMFTAEELEAIDLGLRWVMERAQMGLDAAAAQSLAKLAAVLPAQHQHHFDTSIHLLPPQSIHAAEGSVLRDIRQALRSERKLIITYLDLNGKHSSRTIWPAALAYFEQALVLVAWCESRCDFRHFRTDRIQSLAILDAPPDQRRSALLAKWRIKIQVSTADKN